MLEDILFYLDMFNIRPSKSLGQHFIISKRILQREIQEAELVSTDTVIDIGAGLGFLTELLAEKASKVYAIEIDNNLALILKKRLERFIHNGRVEIIINDVLKIPLPPVTKIVSNPPYHIISELIIKILRELFPKEEFKLMVMIVQEEFARRLLALPGTKNWGRISAAFRYFASGKIVMKVPRNLFFPKPDVDSVMIKAWPTNKKHDVHFDIFEKTTQILFSAPNRKVRGVIKRNLRKTDKNWRKKIRNFPNTLLEKRIRQLTIKEIEKIGLLLFTSQDQPDVRGSANPS